MRATLTKPTRVCAGGCAGVPGWAVSVPHTTATATAAATTTAATIFFFTACLLACLFRPRQASRSGRAVVLTHAPGEIKANSGQVRPGKWIASVTQPAQLYRCSFFREAGESGLHCKPLSPDLQRIFG